MQSVSLAVRAGESVGLVGESGCGKSTLGRAVMGILPPVAERTGRSSLDGVDLTADAEAWRRARGDRLSLVFQDPATRLDPLQRIESHFVEPHPGPPAGDVESRRGQAGPGGAGGGGCATGPGRGSIRTSSPAGCASGS